MISRVAKLHQADRNRRDEVSAQDSASGAAEERVLCSHCGRTASNGISCIGMCVADSDY